MLINVRVNNKKQAKEFVNDLLEELGKDSTESLEYADQQIQIIPEIRTEHASEGPNDIAMDSYLTVNITVGDLDFKTQEVIQRHKNLLHRL